MVVDDMVFSTLDELAVRLGPRIGDQRQGFEFVACVERIRKQLQRDRCELDVPQKLIRSCEGPPGCEGWRRWVSHPASPYP